MKKLIYHNVERAPAHVGPFSHAVECDGWVQLTGQMPTYPGDDSRVLPEGIEAQTKRVMDNLVIILIDLHLSLSDVVSCRVFLTQFKTDFEKMNNTYKSYFDKGQLPARTCVGVTALARDALVEIDMVVRRPQGQK